MRKKLMHLVWSFLFVCLFYLVIWLQRIFNMPKPVVQRLISHFSLHIDLSCRSQSPLLPSCLPSILSSLSKYL